MRLTSPQPLEIYPRPSSNENAHWNPLSTVPLLDGYKIVAANVDGNPVRLSSMYGMPNVLSGVDKSDKPRGFITYWVVPAGNSYRASGLPDSTFDPYRDIYYSREDSVIRKAWERFYTEVGVDSQRASYESDAALVRQHFTYDLRPLSRSFVAKVNDYDVAIGDTGARAKITVRLLEQKRAQCNLANSMLAWRYPDELLYVTGFLNKPTTADRSQNAMVMSSTEAHAWAVTHDGQIVDATPVRSDKDYTEVFSEAAVVAPNNPEKSPPDRPYEAVALGGLLAGVAFWHRKDVKRMIVQQRVARLMKQPHAMSDLYDVAAKALYARSDSPVKPSRGKSWSDAHARISKNISPESIETIKKRAGRKVARRVKLVHRASALGVLPD